MIIFKWCWKTTLAKYLIKLIEIKLITIHIDGDNLEKFIIMILI